MSGEGRRGPGRPRGSTARGEETRRRLYETAVRLISERGWEGTTLRDVAAEAGVSPGLLYRYFPSKRAVVLKLYDRLSREYAEEAARMQAGPWRSRFLSALAASLQVLGPHRAALVALVPVLVSGTEEGLFASQTAFSRLRVQEVFATAAAGASDAPPPAVAMALGRMLYLAHLSVILWWLLEKSPDQRATGKLVALLERGLPLFATALRLPPVRSLLMAGDALVSEALFDDTDPGQRGQPNGTKE